MIKTLKSLLTTRNGHTLPAVLNIITILLSLRGILKSKSTFWAMINMVNVGISGYLLFKNAKGMLKDKIG